VGHLGLLARRLERFYRQSGTGIAFAAFGLGGVALTVTIFPLLNILIPNRQRRAGIAQHVVSRSWRLFIQTLVWARLMDVIYEGEEVLQNEAGTVVVANHPSLLDIVLIISVMKRAQCVVKEEVWKNPFMRGVIKATDYIPNLGDPEKTLACCVNALKSGNNLVIFPEGTRTVPGRPLRLQRGFANIAIRAGAPIRIVSVTCAPPLLQKGVKWYKSPLRRPCFRVRVGERIEPADLSYSRIPGCAARDITSRIAKSFEEVICYEPA
jgi:1-acyl-sn-glycerol-3-phosphate acyltransferase